MKVNLSRLSNNQTQSLRKQTGAVLIVALSLLVILTILGISVMESSVIEEKMAGNNLDRNVAFQSAESALRQAELWLSQQPSRPVPVTVPGANRVMVLNTMRTDNNSTMWWRDADKNNAWWTAANTNTLTPVELTMSERVVNLPRYVIEEYDVVCDGAINDPNASACKVIYRIIARGWGGSVSTTVMLQSLFAKRY